MFLSDLPAGISRFLRATSERDSVALLDAFTDDAVLMDMGEVRRGPEISEWNDKAYLGSNVRVHPIHVEERDGSIVLAVAVDGDYASFGVTEPFQLDWHFLLAGDRIAALRMVEVKHGLPKPIQDFINGMNLHHGEAMVAPFVEDAVTNDQQREYVGNAAIREWADRAIIGDKVTMYVANVLEHPGGYAILARVTGEYDKSNLPDPLELRFYFTLAGDGIGQLVVIPVRRAA
jgi:hypothetical protein